MRKAPFVVLGGGLSGLAAAYRKSQGGTKGMLLERLGSYGGWVQTHQNGYELGPKSIRGEGSGNTLALIRELGLGVEWCSPAAQGMRIQGKDGKIVKFGLELLSQPAIAREVLREGVEGRALSSTDQSVYDFFAGRFGEHVCHSMIDPLIRGVFSGDIRQLSMRTCLPMFVHMVQQYGSVSRGVVAQDLKKMVFGAVDPPVGRFFKVQGGNYKLIEGLVDHLRGKACVELVPGVEIDRIDIEEGVISYGKETIQTDHILSTLPANELYRILNASGYGSKDIYRPWLHFMERMPMFHIATATVRVKRVSRRLDGFGILCSSTLGEPLLGLAYDSNMFDRQRGEEEDAVVTAMIGGHVDNEGVGRMSNEEIGELGMKYVKAYIGGEGYELMQSRVLRHALPQYEVGFLDRMEEIDELLAKHTKLQLGGSSFRGVSVNRLVDWAFSL